MYHTIEEFTNSWESVSTTTAKILNVLTDESLNQAVSEGHRTIGRMAWHIVCTIPEMGDKMGLEFGDFDYESPAPTSAKEICDTYVKIAKTLLDAIKLDWDDDIAVCLGPLDVRMTGVRPIRISDRCLSFEPEGDANSSTVQITNASDLLRRVNYQ